MLSNRPSDTQSIIGAGPSADLIQENQAAGGRAVQDVSRFDHLHHEGALSGGQVVRGSHARENPIDQSDAGFCRRYEAPDLRQQNDQRDLAEVGAFTPPYWPVRITTVPSQSRTGCWARTSIRLSLNDRVAAFR